MTAFFVFIFGIMYGLMNEVLHHPEVKYNERKAQ